MEEITQAEANEYKQVAGLLAHDIDLLNQAAKDPALSADRLRRQIARLWEGKEETIRNPEARQRRYAAASLVWGAVESGLVRCEPVNARQVRTANPSPELWEMLRFCDEHNQTEAS